jgi:hypothetical protein
MAIAGREAIPAPQFLSHYKSDALLREDRMTIKRRKIGTTKLHVTELGLGGAPMGGFRTTISDAEATALVDAAYEGGVRYFDTSPYYGYGRSELRMGAALREKPRDAYVLSTKVGRVLHAMRPGERPPIDFRENGLPGFAPRSEAECGAPIGEDPGRAMERA